jgi:hypothetical protein
MNVWMIYLFWVKINHNVFVEKDIFWIKLEINVKNAILDVKVVWMNLQNVLPAFKNKTDFIKYYRINVIVLKDSLK